MWDCSELARGTPPTPLWIPAQGRNDESGATPVVPARAGTWENPVAEGLEAAARPLARTFLDSGKSRSDGRGGLSDGFGQGLFIVIPSDFFVVTLSDSEGSKVLDCIPLFNIRTGFFLKDIDSSPTAQNDIFFRPPALIKTELPWDDPGGRRRGWATFERFVTTEKEGVPADQRGLLRSPDAYLLTPYEVSQGISVLNITWEGVPSTGCHSPQMVLGLMAQMPLRRAMGTP